MNRRRARTLLPALLLAMLAVTIAVSADVTTSAAFAERDSPAETASPFQVVRIYYDKIADLAALTGYDLFEANNLRERYVLAAVRGDELQWLLSAGWRVEHHSSDQITINRQLYYSGYRTVDEIYTKIGALSGQFPGLVDVYPYGQSYCKSVGGCETPGGEQTPGYDLLAVRVTNETVSGSSSLADGAVQRGSKPVFFMLANIHARELTTPELALRWLNLLLEQYGHDPDITWLVDHQELWIIPLANPDGHWITELGDDPAYGGYPLMHRKNFDTDTDGDGMADCSLWPSASYSHFGVDLNRNHSYGWLAPGSFTTSCSPTYSGPSAASEPETAALQELVRALYADRRGPQDGDQAAADTSGILLTLHNYGELVLRPWGFKSELSPDEAGLKAIGDRLASINSYRSCRPPECLYTAHGTTDDWAYGELGLPAYTFEIGDSFSPDYAVIDREQWPTNRGAFLHAALLARQPYRLIEGPDILQIAVTENRFAGLVSLTAELSDANQVSAADYSLDIPFWSPSAEPQAMEVRSTDHASGSAIFDAQIDTLELSAGKHIVFIRGRDTAGHTGITRAAFINITDPSLPLQTQMFMPVTPAN